MADEAKAFVREVWGLQGTAYVFVGLRCFAKLSALGREGLAWDDVLMALATVSRVYVCPSMI
jgi:hypothetical protein